MVRLAIVLKASPERAQELADAFRFLIVSTKLDLGCLGCAASVEPDSSVHYVEEWVSEADMRRRVQSERFTSVLALLESADAPPHVQFDFITRTRGLDYVAEVREPRAHNGEASYASPQEPER